MAALHGEKTTLVWKDKLRNYNNTDIFQDERKVATLCDEDRFLLWDNRGKNENTSNHLLDNKNIILEELTAMQNSDNLKCKIKQKRFYFALKNNALVSRVCKSCQDISIEKDILNIVRGRSECNVMKSR